MVYSLVLVLPPHSPALWLCHAYTKVLSLVLMPPLTTTTTMTAIEAADRRPDSGFSRLLREVINVVGLALQVYNFDYIATRPTVWGPTTWTVRIPICPNSERVLRRWSVWIWWSFYRYIAILVLVRRWCRLLIINSEFEWDAMGWAELRWDGDQGGGEELHWGAASWFFYS